MKIPQWIRQVLGFIIIIVGVILSLGGVTAIFGVPLGIAGIFLLRAIGFED